MTTESKNKPREKAPEKSWGKPHEKPKRKGVWSDVETFTDPESGLAVIVTERTRGAPAYSFQIVAIDDRGVNKFIQVPCSGTVDVEHVVYSLAKRAREFIAEKMVENKMREEAAKEKAKDKKHEDGSKKTRRGKRGSGTSKHGGLSALARADAQVGGHDYVGPTRRRRDKKKAKSA